MSTSSDPVHIALLGEFGLTIDGRSCPLPTAAARLLALLALRPCGLDRLSAEEELWPEATRGRSSANLRSALWRVRQVGGRGVIDSSRTRIRLCAGVSTDMHLETQRVRRILADDMDYDDCVNVAIGNLSLGLLPGWGEEWLLLDRERWDQVRMHGLEGLARRCLASGSYLTALEAAISAVELEPYRESAQRVLIQIHIAEGNYASALYQYQRFRGTLQRELGVAPTSELSRLIQPLTIG